MNLIKISTQCTPSNLSGFDCSEVFTNEPPEYDTETETIEPLLPELIEDEWRVQWHTRDLTEQEIKARLPVDWDGLNAANTLPPDTYTNVITHTLSAQ